MSLIFVLIVFLFESVVPILIICFIFNAIKNSKSTNETRNNKKQNSYNDRNNYGNRYNNNNFGGEYKSNDFSEGKTLRDFYKDNSTIASSNEEMKRSQEARKAYLKERFGDKLEAKRDVESSRTQTKPDIYSGLDIDNGVDSVIKDGVNLDTNFDSILDSTLSSTFNYDLSDRFGPKFDDRFGTLIEKKDDGAVQDNVEESFIDSLLREYGVEKKTYEWEKR